MRQRWRFGDIEGWFYVITITLILALDYGCCAYWNVLCPKCQQRYVASVSSYKVKETSRTKGGLRLDLSEAPGPVDMDDLDRRVAAMTACLDEEAKKVGYRPTDRSWGCPRFVDPGKWKRDCTVIKVVKAAPPSPCSPQWEFLPIAADPRLCEAKGLPPTPACPCRWRTVTQDGMYVITPPALYLWELGTIITGCLNIWSSPFAKCLVH